MGHEVLSCWNCGERLDDVPLPVSRHEYCTQCAEAVHCCRMCIHYDRDVADQCREDRAEPPTDKETANFCDYFSPRFSAGGGTAGAESGAGRSRQEEARAKLDALFGGGDDSDSKGS